MLVSRDQNRPPTIWIGERWRSLFLLTFDLCRIDAGTNNPSVCAPLGNQDNIVYQNKVRDPEFEWVRHAGSA
jgi:hypothetical protein